MSNKGESFVFSKKKKREQICCDDIMFFESEGHYVLLHMKNGEIHRIRSSLASFIQKVDCRQFARVHRAFVVNLEYVHKIKGGKVFLYGGCKEVPLSRTFKHTVAEALEALKEGKYISQ